MPLPIIPHDLFGADCCGCLVETVSATTEFVCNECGAQIPTPEVHRVVMQMESTEATCPHCEIAGVQGGHPHRFRDTLAVELLLDAVPMERVSILLGHSSVKITERHYAPWVQARQAQLESDLVRAWRNDPIAQAEMLRGDTASQDRDGLRMAATYPRHGTGKTAN